MTLRILSLGAGVQSSTLALMIAKGEVPPVDCSIFADTQAEPGAIYNWLDWLETKLPFPVYRVTAGNLMEDSLKLITSKSGFVYLRTFAPMFVLMKRKIGMVQRKCTTEYKIKPLYKKVKELVGEKAIKDWKKLKKQYKHVPPLVEMVIGISRDESERMRTPYEPWVKNCYPLVDSAITRGDCLDWMEQYTYPTPPRSACIMCPYRNDDEWEQLPPHEISRAAAWERRLQQQQQQECEKRQKGPMFIHSSCKPIDQINFKSPGKQLNLFKNECTGMCGN